MQIIKILVKQIKEEIKDSRKYIELALKNKDKNKELADVYYTLSIEEMGHCDKLHNAVVKEINKFKLTGKEVPPVMETIWDWQHSEIIEEASEVKILIDMYRK